MFGLGIGLNKIVSVIVDVVSRLWSTASFSWSDNNQKWSK